MLKWFIKIGKFAYSINLFLHDFYHVENSGEKKFIVAFGKNLRKVRENRGYTQERLANEMGVEISQISRIERGIINTSIGTVYTIALTLNMSPSDLFKFDPILEKG